MGHRGEAEERTGELAVDGITRPRQRAAAQRHDVGALIGVGEAVGVAQKHFRISVEILRAVDGLGLSQMGIAGHDMADVFFGKPYQG